MTIEELKNKANEDGNLLVNKTFETCKLSDIKNKGNSTKFKYCGVYILTDEDNQIVYIGSSYARTVRERLLQYQQENGTGNCTLYKDLIDGGKCLETNAGDYIKSLTANAFSDESLEYKLINLADGVVNIAGK